MINVNGEYVSNQKLEYVKSMKILAIETSCDETASAVLEVKSNKQAVFKLLSNVVASQVKLHAKYGGVYPFLAKREHQKNLPLVYKKALLKAGNPKIDLLAVTSGPGLEPCLWVGINFAQKISKKLNIPLVPVNHIESHILANFLNLKPKTLNLKFIFPALALVVSGGHTELILMEKIGKYKILGGTRDDAAGECFDKVARLLGLGYPGGPAIAKAAEKFHVANQKDQIKLPRPMLYHKNYDFSFSGLKTAALYLIKELIKNNKKLTPSQTNEIAHETQQAIVDVLLFKTLKAAKDYKVRSIILGGGVVANSKLRKQFEEKIKKELPGIGYIKPNLKYCTDNAAMTAITGYYQWQKKKKWPAIEADSNLRVDATT